MAVVHTIIEVLIKLQGTKIRLFMTTSEWAFTRCAFTYRVPMFLCCYIDRENILLFMHLINAWIPLFGCYL